jgi:lysophosphatidylcholine acyltransferase/lyso-PAF acetyltransferase
MLRPGKGKAGLPPSRRAAPPPPSSSLAAAAASSAAALAVEALRRPELNYLASPTPSWRPRSHLQWLRLVVCSLTLLPLRVVGITLVVALAALAAVIGTLGAPTLGPAAALRPPGLWRAPFFFVARQCLRAFLWMLGVLWVEERGARPAVANKARAAVVICNHLGPIEGIFLAWRFGDCAMLAEQSSFANPVLRAIARGVGIILFDRKVTGGIKELIVRLAREPAAPQLIIFPEGTCSNGSALLQFKPGAFIPLVRVQPCVARLPYKHFQPCWVSLGPPLGEILLRMMTSVFSRLSIEYLEPVEPFAEEREHNDFMSYQRRIRKRMAAALGAPCTELGLDDITLGIIASRAHVSPEIALVNLHDVQEIVRISPKEAGALLNLYLQSAAGAGAGAGAAPADASGRISFEQFLDLFALMGREVGALGLGGSFDPREPGTSAMLLRLFESLPHDAEGRTDFRSFLVALALLNTREQAHAANLSPPSRPNRSEALALAFRMLDTEGKGRVGARRLGVVLRMVWPELPDARMREIFAAASGGGGFVDEAAFVAWCERPEVAVTMPLFRRAVLGVGGDAIELAAQRAAAVRDAHSAAKAAAAAARKGK